MLPTMQVGFGICLNPLALIAPWQLVCRIVSAIEKPEDGLLAYFGQIIPNVHSGHISNLQCIPKAYSYCDNCN